MPGGGRINQHQWLYFVAGALTSITVTHFFARIRLEKSKSNDEDDSSKDSGDQRLRAFVQDDALSPHRKLSPLPEEYRAEQLSRNSLYFGSDALDKKIRPSSVAVIGVGGVGSHAAHLLARSGVEHLTLVDFDNVTLSSLNRHACATLSDVGTPKVECLRKFLAEVCPDCVVTTHCQMYTDVDGKTILLDEGVAGGKKSKFDYIADCIDDVPTKVALMAHCIELGVRVLSCMGAGGKADPTRIHIGDLASASRDPLAAKVRYALRRRLDDDMLSVIDGPSADGLSMLEAVYSSEKVTVRLSELTDEQANDPGKFGAVGGMRLRVVPVLGTMPAIMGMAMAARIITEIGGKCFSPVPAERVGKNVRHKLYQRFMTREKNLQKGVKQEEKERKKNNIWTGPVQIDDGSVEYIMSELWRNRCAMTREGLGKVMGLARWDLSKPSIPSNIVLLTAGALAKFDKLGGSREFMIDGDDAIIRKNIDRRLSSIKDIVADSLEF